MCEGLGLGTNTLAALVTRGCSEMTRLAVKMGARPDTLAGSLTRLRRRRVLTLTLMTLAHYTCYRCCRH
jgi:hypothetical protein